MKVSLGPIVFQLTEDSRRLDETFGFIDVFAFFL